ncbi:hypothetical protein ACH4S8_14055 [Streptomyces sp. NPDC021080]|uniref:hypothetical protein n=1 Tax=Streptomyces sp. NPDC021080 TaxID=3365110 RepID=UPI0037ABA2FA
MRSATRAYSLVVATVPVLLLASPTAFAIGDKHGQAPPHPGPSGGSSGSTLTAKATDTGIKVTQVSGSTSGTSPKALAPVDPNWKPPACWYEPVATPQARRTPPGTQGK